MNLFISYAHKDIQLVKRLVTLLAQAGHDVWFDTALQAGQSWQQQLEDEIAGCDVFVYVMTPNSAWDVSEWCHWEFVTAVEHDKPVLPLLVKPVKLPVAISRLQYADLTKGFRKDVITKMLADLEALHVKHIQNLPAKPSQPSGEPSRVTIRQNITASGNAQVNAVGQQNIGNQTTIGNQTIHQSSNSNAVVLGLIFVVIIAVIAIVIVAVLPNMTNGNAQAVTETDQPTATEVSTSTPIATPATPFVTGDEETMIRTGPDVGFGMLTMWDGRALDILGVSADGGWYQARLRDGRVGWVINSQTVVDVSGNLDVIPTVVVTSTPTPVVTDTPTATSTPTVTQTPEATNTPVIPPTATITPSPIIALTATPDQCIGMIPGVGGMINQVKVLPNPSSPSKSPVQRGASVVVLDKIEDFGTVWYQIEYGDNVGWIGEDYVDVPANCP